MITLRLLTDADVPEIKSWPAYPPEFAGLDYSLRDGGWLDMYRNDPHNGIFVAADECGIVGFSLLLRDHDGPPELMVALHPGRIGGGLGKTVVFGFLIGVVGCYNGLATRGGTEGLGRSTTGTVVASCLVVFISDFFLTKFFWWLAGW